MATHDVTLPGSTRALFPPRCVVCEREHPGHETEVTVTGADPGPVLTDAALQAMGQQALQGTNLRFTVRVPACPGCARGLRWRHFLKAAALYGGALGGVVWLVLAIMWWDSKVLGILGLIVGIAEPVLWELFRPPPFTTTPAHGKVTYEFRSERCAREFADLNAPTQNH